MARSSVVQMACALGCRDITQTLNEPPASELQNPEGPDDQGKQPASAVGTFQSTENEERMIWYICKGHSAIKLQQTNERGVMQVISG